MHSRYFPSLRQSATRSKNNGSCGSGGIIPEVRGEEHSRGSGCAQANKRANNKILNLTVSQQKFFKYWKCAIPPPAFCNRFHDWDTCLLKINKEVDGAWTLCCVLTVWPVKYSLFSGQTFPKTFARVVYNTGQVLGGSPYSTMLGPT